MLGLHKSEGWFSASIAVFVLALALPSQAQVSDSSLVIGGLGAPGCGAGALTDPPTLENGTTEASGQLDFSYNSLTSVLTVTVTNTSPVVPGVPNPVISRILFNLPQGACANAVLLSQSGASGPAPEFDLAVDTNLFDGVGSLFGSCFGKFGIRLDNPDGVQGSIANPAASVYPGPVPSMVIGPAVFVIQITTSSGAGSSLIAEAFSNSRSLNPPGTTQTNAAFKYQDTSGGGYIGNAPTAGGGSPAAWIVGTPMGGHTITAFFTGTPAWEGCMFAATTPGPITALGITFPIGPDLFPVFGGFLPTEGILFTSIPLPTVPVDIATVTFYSIVVLASPDHRTISVSEQFSLSIVF